MIQNYILNFAAAYIISSSQGAVFAKPSLIELPMPEEPKKEEVYRPPTTAVRLKSELDAVENFDEILRPKHINDFI